MKKLFAVLLIVALLLPFSVLADSPDVLCGRWVFYWDTRPMNETYNNGNPMMSFLTLSYDLFFHEDGSLSMVSASMDKSGKFTLQYPAADGLWMVSPEGDVTIRTLNNTFKARLDDAGRLLVYFTEEVPYPFIKVASYDFISETSK